MPLNDAHSSFSSLFPTFSVKHTIFSALTPAPPDLPLAQWASPGWKHLLSWWSVVLSACEKCAGVAGRITWFLPRCQFLHWSSGQRGLIWLPVCVTASCLFQTFKSGFTATRNEAIALSSPVKAQFWLVHKRKRIWYKLPLENTSPSSAAVFFCDVEDNVSRN